MSPSSRSEIRELLKQHSLFSTLDAVILDEISSKCRVKNLGSNELIIKEGRIVDEEFYLLVEGKAEVFVSDAEGKEYVVSTLSAGDVFGEAIMFNEHDRTASVRTTTSSDIIIISKQLIEQLADKSSLYQLFQKLGSQTLNYLKTTDLKAMQLIKLQKNMAFFMINLTVFLSLFSIATPYAQEHIKITDPRWITVSIIFIGVLFLITRLLFMKIPLSAIGISKNNLGLSSIGEAVIISLAVVLAIILLKYILINYTTGFHNSDLFNTSREHTFKVHGVYRSNMEVFSYALVYCIHAFFQEVLARGAIQSTFKQFLIFKHKNMAAIFLASFVFACAHAYYGAVAVLQVFFPGLLWGWIYERQGNIFGAAISHAIIGVCVLDFIGPM